MERAFKSLLVFLSYLLIITTVILIFAIPPYIKSDKQVDFFSAASISENIKNMELNMTSIIYVKNAKGKWQEYQRLHGDENRIWVEMEKIPDNLKNAFIAIEDERFYSHTGVDWKRTIGAVGNFVFKFDDTEFGGSTITQQLIKNVTQDDGRNAYRKFREIVRATLIEQHLEKEEILEAYLNTIALGNGINGVQVAANYYFNKDVEDLTILECASLAAITKNPSKFNPVTGMKENKERRNTVLDKMLELEMISEKEHKKAYNKKIKIDNSQKKDYEAEINNYFVDALIEQVIADLAKEYECDESIASSMLYNGGYKIYSTLDTDIQNAMEDVYMNTDKYFSLKGKDFEGNEVHVQSAMTIMDYSGHIVGIVGGAGEKTVNRGLNRAVDSPRQPGSTMKPIGVYALAIENDLIHYTSKVKDEPIENYYPDGKKGPKEWYGYYKGTITVDYAIRKSANTIPVILLKELGINTSYKFLTKQLKCKHITKTDKNLSALALGGCTYGITTTESAAAYAIFGNQGVYHNPTTYHKVESIDGEVILQYNKKGKQVISPATATIMNHLLQGVVYGREGTGGRIAGFDYSMKAFAKTGTSSESNDLWMVAGSPYYVGSVWYGFDKQQQIHSTSGAADIWRDVMREVHKGLEPKSFEDSEDVYRKGIGYYKDETSPDNVLYSESKADTSSKTESDEESDSSSSKNSSASKPSSSKPKKPKPSDSSSSKPSDSTTSKPSDTTSKPSGTSSESTSHSSSKPSKPKPEKPSSTTSSKPEVSKPSSSKVPDPSVSESSSESVSVSEPEVSKPVEPEPEISPEVPVSSESPPTLETDSSPELAD